LEVPTDATAKAVAWLPFQRFPRLGPRPAVRTNPYGVFCDELLVLSRTLDHLRFLLADPDGLLPHHHPTAVEGIWLIGARLQRVQEALRMAVAGQEPANPV
jgi:hypothetical protein